MSEEGKAKGQETNSWSTERVRVVVAREEISSAATVVEGTTYVPACSCLFR